MQSKFYRVIGNKIWRLKSDEIGPFYFSFDRKTIYNFWTDYWNLTAEQRNLFDKEFPTIASLKNPDVSRPPEPEDDMEDIEEEYEYSD